MLKAAVMEDDEKILVQAAARVVLVGDRGSLASQLDRTEWRHPLPGPLADCVGSRETGTTNRFSLPADLLFANGLGGFTPDGREYCLLIVRPGPAAQKRQRTARASVRCLSSPRSRTLVQCDCQPDVRIPGLRERPGVYLVGEQPDESADTVEQ